MSITQYSTKSAGELWRFNVKIKGRTITRRGFKTKKEARVAELELRNEANKGVNLSKQQMVLSDYLDIWMDHGNNRNWTPKHKQRISQLMEPVKKELGHIKLTNLLETHVVKARHKFRSFWSEQTIKHCEVQLKAALRDAVRNKYISISPLWDFNTVDMKNAPLKELQVFEPNEQKSLLAAAREYSDGTDQRWFALIYLALNTGLRRGELFALQWKHLELEKGLLHVRQAMHWPPKINEGVLKKPKSRAGTRTINFLGNEVSELKRYQLWTKEFNLKLRNKLTPNDFVFFSDNLKPLGVNAYRSRWATIQKLANVPYRDFHSIRHTHASVLIALGYDIKFVQERLGHSSAKITLDTYGHLFEEKKFDKSRDNLRDNLLGVNHA